MRIRVQIQIGKIILIIIISFISLNLSAFVHADSDWTTNRYDVRRAGHQITKGNGNISNYGIVWAKSLNYWIYGEPIVANIDLIGNKEIIVGNDGGYLYCLNDLGEINWEFECEATKYGIKISSAPALYDITGNDSLEIIFCSSNGKIYCLSAWGKLIWEYQTNHIIESSPALGDITGDGNVDIVVLNFDGLYVLTSNGELIWKFEIYEGGLSSPSIIDIDRDGDNEIIITALNGKVYAVTTIVNSEILNQSVEFQPKILWSFKTDKPNNIGFVSSPVLIDINKDGNVETIIGASDSSLYCLDYNGDKLWGTYLDGPIYTTPSVADINSDGDYEIIVGTSGNNLYALNLTGDYLWHIEYNKKVNCGLTIFDVDGDGFLEITSIDKTHHLYGPDESNNKVIYSINIINYNGETIKRLKYLTECYDEFYGITIADLQSDGKLEILTGTHDGYLYCYGELDLKNSEEIDDYINLDHDDGNYIDDLYFQTIIAVLLIIIAILIIMKLRKKERMNV